MSTASLTYGQFARLCDENHVVIVHVGSELLPEYRLKHEGETLFQGDLNRCGDFIQGYRRGRLRQ